MSSHGVIHLAARTYRCALSLTHHDVAAWLWVRLARAFPGAVAAVLMPDHVHLVTPAKDVAVARAAFARITGNLTRTRLARGAVRWDDIDLPQPITDPVKVLRNLRYVALNPVRAGLATDPLAWPWSTYRDVMGAIADPWVTDARVAALVGRPLATFRPWFHRYVSSDPSCNVAGSPAPRGSSLAELGAAPLAWIADAAASSSRGCRDDVRRRSPTRALFLAAAQHAHAHAPARLADACGITRRAVHASRAHAADPRSTRSLEAALLCLGDDRLRITSRRE